MLKRLIILLLCASLGAACTRNASTPEPTSPPLNFPATSSAPPAPCPPADLRISASSSSVGDSLMLGLTLSNRSGTACVLTAPVWIGLETTAGKTLEVQVENGAAVPATLQPGEGAILALTWSNFCSDQPGGIRVRVGLSDKDEVQAALQPDSLPPCLNKNKPSTLLAAAYSSPP